MASSEEDPGELNKAGGSGEAAEKSSDESSPEAEEEEEGSGDSDYGDAMEEIVIEEDGEEEQVVEEEEEEEGDENEDVLVEQEEEEEGEAVEEDLVEEEDEFNEAIEDEEEDEEEGQYRAAQVEEERELDAVEYDLAIPPQHSYLETVMQRVEGYNFWLEGERVELLLIPLDVIVIPGQTIPLRIRDTSLQFAMIRNVLDRNQITFGAVHMLAEREQVLLHRTWSQCGVTVQILEVSEHTQNQIVLKCKGRQRFKTVSTSHIRGSNLNLHATVSILADHLPSRIQDPSGEYHHAVKYAWHPVWMYRLHDVYEIMEKIKREIRDAIPHVKLEVAPLDPIMFSYWLISAMPFKFNQRVEMLRQNSLAVRLSSQLTHLRDLRKIDYCCRLCGAVVIRATHLVSMSADSPFFVNPHGNVFETVTAYSVLNCFAVGEPTERDSWFPGYAWNNIFCHNCVSCLGWKFQAVSGEAKPQVFYGAQRNAVQVKYNSELEGSAG